MADDKEPTKEAKEKAEHIKRQIEKIKGNRLKYRRERRKRAAELEMKLQNEDIGQDSKRQLQIQYFLDESHSLRAQRSDGLKTKASDFQVIKIIGKGAFGEVRIVRHKKNLKILAMKTMLKSMMEAKNQLGHIVAERDIMTDAESPWLVTLFYAFQDAKYLYLVMEFCGGGDLMGLLIKKDILSEKDTRFYMSELAAAINYVHTLGYVHRDLKPDNVLIGNDGHIRLSDFGLAKSFKSTVDASLDNWQQYVATLKQEEIQKMKDDQKEDGKTKKKHQKIFSTVGTPDYIALEVLYQKGYDKMVDWWSMGVIMFECLCGYAPFHANDPLATCKMVDWWSMGVIMFECLCGYAPFHANDPLATCRKIVRYQRYFKIPGDIKLTKQAVDLMNNLVCPAHRRIGWEKITAHPWFKKLDWDNLGDISPAFKPNLKNEFDAKYFDESIEQEFDDLDNNDGGDNIGQSGFSTSADNANKVFAYTYTRKQGQELAKQLKQNKK
eukprot:CAMPEP_0201591778 /NCGR_PEP_ID=MMETSP0190_2-20130828/189855_1 /ASSEMBLY_ACC=CAM_ASM_000263 /TAXON_ID=37353 /ORGANISM="Rosalina sp." /LENGTH=494 /DNA_ID=CAMNT_0048050249 /DNA_START=31 /DNA_END=1515 /DNA_ORIENTATION=-